MSAIHDDEEEYSELCSRYGEKSDGGPYGEHAKKLKARRDKDRADERRVERGESPARNLSDAELEAELARRKAEREENALFTPVPFPDFTRLQKIVVEGAEGMRRSKRNDEGLPALVFQEAVTAVFGMKFWEWRNKQKW